MTTRLELSPTEETRAQLERLARARGLICTEGRQKDRPNISALIAQLANEEEARTAEIPTLAAVAKCDPERARRIIFGALGLHDGNGEAARDSLGRALGRHEPVSRKDWQTAIAALGIQPEIVSRFPKQRGGSSAVVKE